MILGVLLVLSACTTQEPAPTTTVAPPAPTTIAPVVTEPTVAPVTTTTVPVDPIEAELLALIAVTEELRGLTFKQAPTVLLVSSGEFQTRIEALFDEAVAVNDGFEEQLYKLLGILTPEQSLQDIFEGLAPGNAPFYDDATRSLVVLDPGDSFTVIDRVAVVHELVHALTDQHFGTTAKRNRLQTGGSYDQELALAALVEGDATYIESLYINSLDDADLADLVASYADTDNSAFAGAPPFIQETLLTPYVDGLEFVLAITDTGGLDALDAAYLSPPTSTEQIRHSEVFLAGDSGRSFEMELIEVDGYSVVESSVWGESALIGLLSGELVSDDVFLAAEGWNGDRFEVLSNGEHIAFRLTFYGDTSADDEEFLNGISSYLSKAVSEDAFAEARHAGNSIIVVVSSDPGAGPVIFDQMDF